MNYTEAVTSIKTIQGGKVKLMTEVLNIIITHYFADNSN